MVVVSIAVIVTMVVGVLAVHLVGAFDGLEDRRLLNASSICCAPTMPC